ncbi:MAG: glycosyltransferase [Actinobacteria bacterium]|nr:glycosyltransferase [Actinomycetota bacterium]
MAALGRAGVPPGSVRTRARMTIRVLQVLSHSAGGIARHVAQVTEALDGDDDFEVDVAAPPDLPVEMPKAPLEVTIPRGALRGHRSAIDALSGLLGDGHYDVIHAHGLRAATDSARAARRLDIPTLVTVHNLVRPEIAGTIRSVAYRWSEPLAVWQSFKTFAVSEQIGVHLRRVARKQSSKIEVLYLGIGEKPEVNRERAEVRSSLDVPIAAPLIVTVSRLDPQKALHVLLRALSLLSPDVYLAVVGKGALEDKLRSLADELGIAERVRWVGFTPNPADQIAAGDVFALSSVWEGIPLAAQEAISLGAPVVATAVGGLPELVEDRVSGRLVPPNKPVALADALSHVLASPEGARRYAKAAKARLDDRFSTERMLDRLRTVYREAAGA